MIRKIFHTLAIALCLFAVSAPMFAHHGTAAYDMTKTITMKGKISKFEFINPHCQIYFDATNEKGVGEQWQAGTDQPESPDEDWMDEGYFEGRRRSHHHRISHQGRHQFDLDRQDPVEGPRAETGFQQLTDRPGLAQL